MKRSDDLLECSMAAWQTMNLCLTDGTVVSRSVGYYEASDKHVVFQSLVYQSMSPSVREVYAVTTVSTTQKTHDREKKVKERRNLVQAKCKSAPQACHGELCQFGGALEVAVCLPRHFQMTIQSIKSCTEDCCPPYLTSE